MKSSMVAAAAAAMLSFACSNTSPVSSVDSTPADLTGQWQGVCTILTPNPPAGTAQDPTSSLANIDFTATETTLTIGTYPALGCPTVEYTTTVVSKYVLAGPAATAPGAQQINYTVESIKLVFANAADVGELNDIKLCGFDNWTAGVAQNIAGIDCFSTGTPLPAVGSSQYDILNVTGNQLRFGLSLHDWTTPTGDGAGTSLAKRPAALNPTEVYAKVVGH